jgi:hypothetical protein
VQVATSKKKVRRVLSCGVLVYCSGGVVLDSWVWCPVVTLRSLVGISVRALYECYSRLVGLLVGSCGSYRTYVRTYIVEGNRRTRSFIPFVRALCVWVVLDVRTYIVEGNKRTRSFIPFVRALCVWVVLVS